MVVPPASPSLTQAGGPYLQFRVPFQSYCGRSDPNASSIAKCRASACIRGIGVGATWLLKTEPNVYSLADLERDGFTDWNGVRNYQARNFLRAMRKGDEVFVYHSSAKPPALVGIAKVLRNAEPDETQFDAGNSYYDPKATRGAPRWFAPRIQFVSELRAPLELAALRPVKELANMRLLQRGSRLSVQPVTPDEARAIKRLMTSLSRNHRG